MRLFTKWVAAGGGLKTPQQLGELVEHDPDLIGNREFYQERVTGNMLINSQNASSATSPVTH